MLVFTIRVEIWEVWGCPGGWHGPYEEIPSNFGRVWSYRTWGKSIFMFLGNIGNSLHHQIPPNWSSGLQIGPRIFLKGVIKPIIFQKMTPNKQKHIGNWTTSQNHHFFIKWIPVLCLCLSPMGPIVQPPINSVTSSQLRHTGDLLGASW